MVNNNWFALYSPYLECNLQCWLLSRQKPILNMWCGLDGNPQHFLFHASCSDGSHTEDVAAR